MKYDSIRIKTISFENGKLACLLSDGKIQNRLIYESDSGCIEFQEENFLSGKIYKYEKQFHKVMQSAIKGNIKPGKEIKAVFIEDFRFLQEDDFHFYIRMDRRKESLMISRSEEACPDIHKIFTDGSFISTTLKSAYGGFIEYPDKERQSFSRSFYNRSNNLMELLAVTEGMQILKEIEKIQINTDSRFVIRGLAQWMHFWRLNHWYTAYGTKVKFAKYWSQLDSLTQGKMLELKWIKGHSGHEDQGFCHDLARKLAGK